MGEILALVGPAAGWVLAGVVLIRVLPLMMQRHLTVVRELIAAFRSAVDKIGTRQDRHEERLERIESKVDQLLPCRRPRPYRPGGDSEPEDAA